ncbi:hypothetical protein Tco_0340154 [Tanacetum coccineum]
MVMSFDVCKMLCHSRFGYLAAQVLSILKDDLSLSNVTIVAISEICHRSKQTRDLFPLSYHKLKKIRELVHLDLGGLYRVRSREGYGTHSLSKFSPDTELVLNPLQDKWTSGDKSLDLSAFKLSRLFFSLLSSGSSSYWRSYRTQLKLSILKVRYKRIDSNLVDIIPSLKCLITKYIREEDPISRLFDDHIVNKWNTFREALITFQPRHLDLGFQFHMLPLSS